MSLALAATLAALAWGPPADGEVSYVDASFYPEGELLDRRFVDLDGDGDLFLCLAVRTPGGEKSYEVLKIVYA